MSKREYFKNQLPELKAIIDANKLKGVKTGPIIMGLYERLSRVFTNH